MSWQLIVESCDPLGRDVQLLIAVMGFVMANLGKEDQCALIIAMVPLFVP